MKLTKPKFSRAFTIVELLVVIVIIGILASITIVAYTGISNRAIVTSLKSDIFNATTQLKSYQVIYGSYPTSMTGNCPTAPINDPGYCLKASTGNTLTYSSIVPTDFHITATSTNNLSYSGTNATSPDLTTSIAGSSVGSACPTGFIPVPGSGTYGTNDFCVMKYAASQVGASNVPTSVPSVQPWVGLSQTTAIANSANVAGCSGCHLITEAEWMTIAQNVLSVASNWSSGTVGSGYIYSGHSDGAPNNALAPDSNDGLGYSGETNTGGNQRRTLTLTNGQIIWDFAGNVYQWTSGTVQGGQPGINGGGYSWREWNNITNPGTLSISPVLKNTGLSGSSNWNSGNGVGQVYSSSDDTTSLYGILRGGYWGSGTYSGVSLLYLSFAPGTSTYTNFGFRVTR